MSGNITELIRILKQKFPIRKLEEHIKTNNYKIEETELDELNKLQTFLSNKNKYTKKIISIISECLEKEYILIENEEVYETFLEWLTLEQSLYYTNSSFSSIIDNDVIYQLPNGEEIVINEERDLLASNGTTGFRTWEAALFLYYYLININANLLSEKEIKNALELGCGTGFLGIFLAKMMPNVNFNLSDGSNLVVDKCIENVEANKLNKNKINVQELIWGNDNNEEEEEEEKNTYDLIFGADVTFDSQYIPALVDTITSKLKANGICIISATIRNEKTISTLYECIEKLGPKWKLEKIYALPSSFCVATTLKEDSTKKHRDDFIKKNWFEDLLADIHIYKIYKQNE